MLVYKAIQLVYILIHDNVQALLDRVVLGDLLRCECFGHRDRVSGAVRRISGLDSAMVDEVV